MVRTESLIDDGMFCHGMSKRQTTTTVNFKCGDTLASSTGVVSS